MRIFLDIGAWNGDTTLLVLKSKHEFDKIYCFEPQLNLCEEIRKIDNPKIVVEEFGLWNKNCKTPVYMYANKRGRKNDGASVYEDKIPVEKKSVEVRMVKASEWFANNINDDDFVVLKMNCEGAECDILDDLMDSGEFSKVDALLVDFDVRKIPSQRHREVELMERLLKCNIPMYICGRNDQFAFRENVWIHGLDMIFKGDLLENK